MKWRLLIKSLVFTAFGLILLLVGYSAGLLVQFRREARFAGYCRIYEKIVLDKQLSTGAFDLALKLPSTSRAQRKPPSNNRPSWTPRASVLPGRKSGPIRFSGRKRRT